MARARAGRLELVAGDRIGQSRRRNINAVLSCLLMAPLGGLAARAWWTELPTETWLVMKRVPALPGIFGAATCVFGVLGLLLGLVGLSVRTQLILGSDRLQVITGTKHVCTQIPYANVAHIELGKDAILKFIGFKLINPDAPGTVILGGVSRRGKWHYRLLNQAWSVPLEQIYDRLEAKLRVT